MYTTRVFSFRSGYRACSRIKRSIAHKNAARVFPDPVGAITSELSPRPAAAHASVWASVGAPNASKNHERTSGENCHNGALSPAMHRV
jgi:hypothetical protein